MNVTLPSTISRFVEDQVANLGYQSPAEYVVGLIEADRRRATRAYYGAEVLRGIQSGPSTPLDAAEWQAIREEVVERYRARTQSPS
jgi:Arc/MetJ-type ribon-helix-helix transcriptional regulator